MPPNAYRKTPTRPVLVRARHEVENTFDHFLKRLAYGFHLPVFKLVNPDIHASLGFPLNVELAYQFCDRFHAFRRANDHQAVGIHLGGYGHFRFVLTRTAAAIRTGPAPRRGISRTLPPLKSPVDCIRHRGRLRFLKVDNLHHGCLRPIHFLECLHQFLRHGQLRW